MHLLMGDFILKPAAYYGMEECQVSNQDQTRGQQCEVLSDNDSPVNHHLSS